MIKLYVFGYVGNLGTKVLIEEKQDELVKQFNQEFITHIKNQIEESLSKDGFNPSLIMSSCRTEFHESSVGADIIRPQCRGEVNECRGEHCEPTVIDYEQIGKGGILAALWKLCDRNKWGLKYSLRKIPILQGTIEIANYFDLNPYRLLTDKAFIIACSDECDCRGRHSVVLCRGEACEPKDCTGEFHEPLCEIGDITNEKKRVRIDGEAEAFLTKDYKDEIDKVIPNYIKKMGLV